MQQNDIVFYTDRSIPCIGKLGGKWKTHCWYVIPIEPFKRVVKRDEKFLRPIEDFKKFLTNTK